MRPVYKEKFLLYFTTVQFESDLNFITYFIQVQIFNAN